MPNRENLSATITLRYNGKIITENQIKILELISKTKSQNKVAKLLNISPSSVSIQIKRLEKKLGMDLIDSSASGTMLREHAQDIVDYYNKMKKRITMEPLIACGFICGEVGKILFEDIIISSFDNILKLYNMDLSGIVGIDDPYWSYRLGDPIPVVYDYMVMVYKEEFDTKNLIGIRYSPQRIMWKILKNHNIPFKITKVVKNPFQAIDLLEEGYSLFLNESFTRYVKGDYIIKKPHFYEDTKHTLNFITLNNDEKTIIKSIKRKKKEIENRGFQMVDSL
ncbi:MAG TPA: LysR family transcriptional regulator [Methanothermococcus okinawensis]|uniref:LysR family transcriptional regulator n=1 Tax=Methanothermococcus okinawensis TaxID=155863 RepID=A0A832YN89_9EURY|nr:LysR family transcriptional regulator [Methanothermococcus okinawensis]